MNFKKLIANLLNDAFLRGSVELEGTTFEDTVSYLKHFLAQAPSSIVPDKLNPHIQHVDQLIFYSKEINELRQSICAVIKNTDEEIEPLKKRVGELEQEANQSKKWSDMEKCANKAQELASNIDQKMKEKKASIAALESDFAKKILRSILNAAFVGADQGNGQARSDGNGYFRPNQSIFIPGGWSGVETAPGHALIYELNIDETEHLCLTVYNSGDGLSYHASHLHRNELRYCPTLTYQLPLSACKDPQFIEFIQEIIRLKTSVQVRKQNARYFYEKLLPALHYFDGKRVAPTQEQLDCATTGQISGTCAQRVLHQMIKSSFASRDQYRQFMYHYEVFAIDECFAQLAKDPTELQYPAVHSQLEKAVCHLLRLLNLTEDESEQPLFLPEFKAQESQKLFGYLEILNSTPLAHNPSPATTAPALTEKPFSLPEVKTQHEHELESIACTETAPTALILMDFQHPPCLLDEVLNVKKQLTDPNKHFTEAEILERIEYFFSHLPLPNNYSDPIPPFYQSVVANDQDRIALYDALKGIDKVYQSALYRVISRPDIQIFPQVIFTHLNLLSMINYVEQKSHPEVMFTKDMFAHIEHLTWEMKQHLVLHYLPYNVQRLKEINALHASGPQINENQIHYYQKVLEQCGDDKMESLRSDFYQKIRDEKINLDNKHDYDSKKRLEELARLKYLIGESVNEKWDYRALYYVLNNIDKAEFSEKYPSIHAVFTRQKKFESVYRSCRGTSHDGFSISSASVSYSSHLSGSSFELTDITSTFKNHKSQGGDIWSHYLPLSENWQQKYFYPNDPFNSYYRRILKTPHHQIPLILDFYHQHLELLSKPNDQLRLEATLFQDDLLSSELSHERANAFFNQFQTLIQKGMDFYKEQDELTLSNLYFIRLAYQVYSYAARLNPERYTPYLTEFRVYIEKELSRSHAPAILKSLWAYPSLMASQLENTWKSPPLLIHALQTYILSQQSTDTVEENYGQNKDRDTVPTQEILSEAVKIERLKSQQQFLRQLESNQSLITPDIIKEILIALGGVNHSATTPTPRGLSLSDVGVVETNGDMQIQGTFPLYHILIDGKNDAHLHLMTGQMSNESGHIHRTLPEHLQAHALFRYLGITPPSHCFTNLDASVISFEQEGVAFRLLKKKNGYAIYAKWSNSWYQLAGLSDQQCKNLQLEDPVLQMHQLPATIQSSDVYLAWIECPQNNQEQPKEMLYTQGMQQAFVTHLETFTTLTKEASPSMLQPESHPLFAALAHFEPVTWMNMLAHTSDATFDIHLPRHRLTFTAKGVDEPIQWKWEDKVYHLQKTPLLFHSDVAHLVFENYAKEQQCLLAIHRFIPTTVRSLKSEYYRLQHDIQEKISSDPFTPSGEETQPSFFSYQVKKGVLIPRTPAEALYLCYVYLADEQPQKAWAALQDCQQRLNGITGTKEELTFLDWIVHHLPDNQREIKTSAQTPEIVSCQLKALSMLALHGFAAVPHEGEVSELAESSPHDATLQFKQSMHELFLLHEHMMPHLDVDYQLSDDEKLSLLRTLTDHQQVMLDGTLQNPLDYEYAHASLTLLKKEKEILEHKAHSQDLSAYEKMRQQTIEAWCKTHRGFTLMTDTLDDTNTIDLSLPKEDIELVQDEKKDLRQKMYSLRDIFYPHNRDIYYALTQLKSGNRRSDEKEKNDLIRALENICIYFEKSRIPEEVITKTICKAFHRCLINGRVPQHEEWYTVSENDEPQTNRQIKKWLSLALELPEARLTVPQFHPSSESHLLICPLEEWQSLPTHLAHVTPPFDPDLQQLNNTFHDHFTQDWQAALKTWVETVPKVEQTPPTALQAGQAKFEQLQRKKALAEDYFSSAASCAQLTIEVNALTTALTSESDRLEQQILTLGNQRLLTLKNRIDHKAKKTKPLDINALLSLYFHQDVARYLSITELAENDITTLHTLLTQYVYTLLKQQQCTRSKIRLDALLAAKNALTQKEARFELAKTFFETNTVDVQNETLISYFQLKSDLLLRTDQSAAIVRLLSMAKDSEKAPHYDECIEKIIMGGGKSKVLIPILAAKKATGSNLIIFEVPKSLLSINRKDWHATSKMLFNQNARVFYFSRRSDCSSKRLEALFNHFTHIMVNQDYLVTAAESLQSLELKFLELLSKPDLENKEWQAQVTWAERILLLLRNQGDLLIDEVHQSLQIKHKFRYAIGPRSEVAPHLIKATIELYGFLDNVHLSQSLTLNDVIKNPKLLADEGLQADFKTHIALHMVEHKDSPLSEFIAQHPSLKSSLLAYLQSESDAILEQLQDVPDELKDQLAFYKEQITTFLPLTLTQVYGEYYGPSLLKARPLLSRLVSIPYAANNSPNEYSRFGDPLEEMNYSVQGLLAAGLPDQFLQTYLIEQQKLAKKEFMDIHLVNLASTPTCIKFDRILKKAGILSPFDQINFKNPTVFAELYSKIKNNTDLVLLCADQVLQQIKLDPSILHSDVFTKISSVHTAQGLTGTPENASTYHDRLHADPKHALGTDEYILAGIKDKNPTLLGCDFEDLETFLAQILKNHATHLHAIIDISATFHGIANITVVKQLAHIFREKQQPLRYILFFNANTLCAFDIKKPDSQRPILLTSSNSDAIAEQLHCPLDQCFTYYDQSHTLGVDIKQASDAEALALIDKDLNRANWLQGDMRMRNLIEGHQKIHFVAPRAFSTRNFDEIVAQFTQNGIVKIQQENFESLLLKMTECIRDDLLKRIYSLPSIEGKAAYFARFEAHFVEHRSESFFQQHANIQSEVDTSLLLTQHQSQLIESWKTLVQATLDEEKMMLGKLENISNKHQQPGFCKKTHWTNASKLGTQQELENQTLQQKQMQLTLKTQEIKEADNSSDKEEAIYLPWQGSDPFSVENQALDIKVLTDICWIDSAPFHFSEHIYASKNFYMSMLNEPFMSKHIKSVFAILFLPDPLRCILLSQEELRDFKGPLSEGAWISTTQHNVLAGTMPEGILTNPSYQNMLEQIRYFNGEVGLLIATSEPLVWMREKSKEKIDFLRTQLLQPRVIQTEKIKRLETSLDTKQSRRIGFFESTSALNQANHDGSLSMI